jgi:hypothetical protein
MTIQPLDLKSIKSYLILSYVEFECVLLLFLGCYVMY